MSIAFERPYFLILLPIVAAVVLYIARGLRIRDKAKKNKYIAFRIFVMWLLVLALSGVSLGKRQDKTTTIFLVDVSDSMSSHRDEIQSYLAKVIADMPKKNQMGIVVFGGSTEVEQFVTDQRIFTEFGTHPVTTATNVENAIATALSIFPSDTAKRLVLISDGQENEGSMMNMATSLQSQNVELAVLPMKTEIGDEVYVDNVTVPDTIRIGDSYAITVTIVSNVDTEAKLSLFSGRTLKGEEEVRLNAGENQFVFYDTADENGFRSYRVQVQAAKDTMTVNNEYSAFAQIEAKAKVLLVEGIKGEGKALEKAFEAGGVFYDIVTPTGAPTTMNQMMEYKSIVLLNVYYDDLKPGFVNNIKSYVKDFAGGLVAIGGDNSFALGGYRDTVLEEVLPVNMDLEGERQIPKMELVLVIDHSGSMSAASSDNSGITCLDLAKAAAVKALETLRKTDAIGVLAFDDTYTWVVEPQEAEDTEAISGKIAGIEVNGGTMIYPALEAAAKKMADSDAQLKHIILLTDGQDSYNNYDSLCETISDAGITVSSVAVGRDANANLLQSLAEKCGGRYYYTDINQGLPRIFAKEVYLSAKEYLINERFTPVVVNNHEIIGSLSEGAPALSGYIASTAKPTATRILVSHKDDPILTVWQYGLGKAVSWNSDASGKWSSQWALWEKYPVFWKNVIDYTITDTGLNEDSLEVVQEGSHATVTYTTKEFSADTKVSAVCTDEKGNASEIEFDPVSPGKYEAKLKTEEVGVYNIALKNQSGEEVVKSVNTATAMQYSAEYRFSERVDSMSKLTVLSGGREITMEDEIFLPIKQMVKANYNIGNLLLVLALCIFMLDVVERRLNLALVTPLFQRLFKNRKGQKNQGAASGAKRPTKPKKAYAGVLNTPVSTEAGEKASHAPSTDGVVSPSRSSAPSTDGMVSPSRSSAPSTDGMKEEQGDKSPEVFSEGEKQRRKKPQKSKKEAPRTLDTDTLLKKQQERNR